VPYPSALKQLLKGVRLIDPGHEDIGKLYPVVGLYFLNRESEEGQHPSSKIHRVG